MVYTVQYSFKALFKLKSSKARLHVQSMCASPGRTIFSSILSFGPQSYNSEKPFCREARIKVRMECTSVQQGVCVYICVLIMFGFTCKIIPSVFLAVTAQCCFKVLPPKTPSLLIYPFTAGGRVFMLSFTFALARQSWRGKFRYLTPTH